MKKVFLLSLNFLPTELKREYEFIQEILKEEGASELVPSTLEEQEKFSKLILSENKKEIQNFILRNEIENIIVSSVYYDDRPCNEHYYDLLLKDLRKNVVFIFHSNGEILNKFKERITKKYPGSPSLFLFKYTTPRTKEFFEVINNHFKISKKPILEKN